MRSFLCLIVAMLLFGGSARAADIPSKYVVIAILYRGCQEKPIWPIVVGDSSKSVDWFDDTYIHDGHSPFWRKHVSDLSVLRRLASDVPHLSANTFVGPKPGKEVEIRVVESGQMRHILTRSKLTDELLNKLILESGKDAELRALILEFKSNVDRYEADLCGPYRNR